MHELSQCVTSHEKAWMRAQVLHRDISVNNVLSYYPYYRDGKLSWSALLVDWATCDYKEEVEQESVQKKHSGTWHFMSAVFLVFPGHFRHAVWHDLESFIHVLHWMCLRFYLTNYTPTWRLRKRVYDLYEYAYRGENGASYGGDTKLEVLSGGWIPFELQGGSVGRRRGLYPLLAMLAKLCEEQYAWLKATSKLPTISKTCSQPQTNTLLALEEYAEEIGPSPSEHVRSATLWLDDKVADDSVPPSPPASTPPKPVLDHAHVRSAFRKVLKGAGTWIDDPKVHDRFALLNPPDERLVVTKRHLDG